MLSDLSPDSSVLITRPDKGRGMVVADRRDYTDKLENILSNKAKFKLLDKTSTTSRENALITLLGQVESEDYLTNHEYQYVKPVSSVSARLCGLSKVHKTNTPLWPYAAASIH